MSGCHQVHRGEEMGDFSFKIGKTWKGALASIAAALKYVIVPIIIITIIASLAGELIGDYLEAVRNAILIFGIPLIVISFFKGFYPKGSQSRLVFALITTALVCLWIWFVLQGGIFELNVEQVTMTVDYSLLVLLFILVAELGGVYYAGEYLSYRNEYLSGGLKEKEKGQNDKRKGEEKRTTEKSQDESEQLTSEASLEKKAVEETKKE